MPADTIGAVLQNKHVAESIPSKTAVRKSRTSGEEITVSAAEIHKMNADKNNWEWVEVPDTDLFGEPHTGVSVNFNQFGPGKHFVSPEMASEVRRLLANRMRGDMRVLQPRQDVVMARIMSKSQLGAPVNPNLDGLNDR